MRALVVLIACGSAAVPAEEPPAPLRCLQKYYGVEPLPVAGGWVAVLADGTRIPYDDGRTKLLEEALDHPAVKDVFARRYHSGAIRTITEPDEDPGRVRLDRVLAHAYPES